jgi:hypothetical protein
LQGYQKQLEKMNSQWKTHRDIEEGETFLLTYLQSWALPEKLQLCSHSENSQQF